MPGTILLGIDVELANESSATYARRGVGFLEGLGIPATWYVTGRTLERYPDLFVAAARSPLVDLQAHTYSHLLFKTVFIEVPPGRTVNGRTDFFLKRGATPDEIDADLARCQQVFADVLGRRPQGLTCPWCYWRGLADRPDLLEIVHRHGFRFLRSFGRNERDGQPVPLAWRPFHYGPQGFPDVLELMAHDYQDDFYYVQFQGLPDASTYPAHLRRVADEVAAGDLVWSLCSHDHSCATDAAFDAKTAWIADLVRHARSLGIRFATGAQFYKEVTK